MAIESAQEMARLSALAAAAGKTMNCAVRINPDVDAKTHAKISTGKSENKFGVDLDTAARMFDAARTMPGIRLCGLASHIGSQMLELSPFDDAFGVMAEFGQELQAAGHTITRMDIGGGIGVPYQPQDVPADLAQFTALVKKHFEGFDGEIYTEPGRYLVADAGVLLSRVVFIKRTSDKVFVVLDAAMNDLMRPAMYDAYHPITAVNTAAGEALMTCDIVGGICETSDLFAQNRQLPARLQAGDLVIIGMAGAYGESMSNTYNARDLVAAVMVDGENHTLVRRRWGIDEQMALERISKFLA